MNKRSPALPFVRWWPGSEADHASRPHPRGAFPQARRRYRRREREGRKVAPTEYDALTVSYLVETLWLPAADADDPSKIAEATFRLISASARQYFGY
jgi:hypothetical protein